MTTRRKPAVAVACGLLAVTAAAAAARAAGTAATRTGTVVSACANPLVDRDTAG